MTQLKIPMNFHSAELLTQSLCMTITDSMAEAGSDAALTVDRLHQAGVFAHELARFLDNLSQAVRGEILVTDDTEEHSELRAVMARRGNPPNVSALFPMVRVGPEDAA